MVDLQSTVITKELKAAYLASAAGKLAEFADAARNRQFPTITRIGHQLKGSGRSYGFPEFSDLGARIEQAGQDRRVSLFDPLADELMTLIQTIRERQSASEPQ